MKINFLLLFLSFCFVSQAQNKRVLVATSVGTLFKLDNNENFKGLGFSTVTGFEYNAVKNLWLTAHINFQTIAYKSQEDRVEIDQKANLTPLLLGGRWLFNNKSSLSPYVSAHGGISFLTIPESTINNGNIRVSNTSKRPFTYAIRAGVQYEVRKIFFPYVEFNAQSLAATKISNQINLGSLNIGIRTYPF